MLSLVPVIERIAPSVEPFDLWPVDHGAGWMRLNGAMSPGEVGMAMWSLLFHSRGDENFDTPVTALRRLAEFDTLYAPGGLLLRDSATGVRAEPGCCCDLFEWRDWVAAAQGAQVDLGHSGAPLLEFHGDFARVWACVGDEDFDWSDGVGDLREGYDGEFIDLPLSALPGLLRRAQQDLAGFLTALGAWADVMAPDHTASLVAAVDAKLSISASLQV